MGRRHAEQRRGGEIEIRLFIVYLSVFWGFPSGSGSGSVGGSCWMPEYTGDDTRDIRWRLKGGGGDGKRKRCLPL
jgi:hypothetical protein